MEGLFELRGYRSRSGLSILENGSFSPYLDVILNFALFEFQLLPGNTVLTLLARHFVWEK